jgi:alpha-tubulin suppressor-like RCC1 family protein
MYIDDTEEVLNSPGRCLVIGSPSAHLYACGKNENGELTFKGYKSVSFPSGVSLPKGEVIMNVSSGANHSAFVSTRGLLYMFGSTLHGKLGIEGLNFNNVSHPTLFPLSRKNPVKEVACGDYHTLCLFENGEIYGWGGTLHRKLGNSTPHPTRMEGLEKIQIVKIGCGDFHSAALSSILIRQRTVVYMGRRRLAF